MANILIIYYYRQHPARATHLDNLYSFRRYSQHRCYYLNVGVWGIPRFIRSFPWDLVIFHDLFMCSRWTREFFTKCTEKVRFLKYSDAVKVVVPQDEFLNMDLVCDFISEFGITHVFSVSPQSEWPLIYRTVDFSKVKFHKVLTGYIDDQRMRKINRMSKGVSRDRPIDIGYRTHPTPFWLGRHAMKKEIIGHIFKDKAAEKGLVADISTRDEDTIPGDDWYRFLLRCKYQIGIEGGASILDWDGTYKRRTEEYLRQHPQASFEEVERECFPNVDGSLRLFALSPRHFECCVTRTCQVLVEGDYDGVLEPGKHYIELKGDFSNLDGVLDTIAKDELREEITARAWQDIVESGAYSYRRFASDVVDTSLQDFPPRPWSFRIALWQLVVYNGMLVRDRMSWLRLTLSVRFIDPVMAALFSYSARFLPQQLRKALRKLFVS